ncbi:alpha/beta hydrolase [Flagellimonas sp. 389]|uniref:alpha/beta hydrolase family protein n=1 Tax=Flagellimonas sp. 389 TaxID=2835862 RepID=UPI001BD39497|nr:alpha/beta hydrolase [Flagellimonas sp. 389]MBS9463428.1 alpha/beta hydrolase [Flagellimonas sp. 389]
MRILEISKKNTILTLFLLLVGINAKAQTDKQSFDFEFEGIQLNGILNIPEDVNPKGIVLIVHGSGRTNAVEKNWYADVRGTILEAGYGTYMWDKMGCGKSGGTFNYNQPVQNSVLEVIAAITQLQQKKIPGSEHIGLWGISRAGWINPLVINKSKDIKFWISVSGVDDKENFSYLFEENLKINGVPKDSIQILSDELINNYRLTHSGADFETYMTATKNLRKNSFLSRFNNGRKVTEEGYYEYQKTFMKAGFDEETGLQVYIEDFESVLSTIDCPVLALFGEKDKNVDWRKTKTLYKNTLGKNIDLTIKSFPDCNHNLFQCKTGGFYEFQDTGLPRERCNGFLNTIKNWLHEIETHKK